MILKKVGKSKTLTVTPLGEPGVNGSILGTLASSLEVFEGSFLFFWAGFSLFFGGNVLSRCWRIWLFAIISLFLNYLAGFWQPQLGISIYDHYLRIEEPVSSFVFSSVFFFITSSGVSASTHFFGTGTIISSSEFLRASGFRAFGVTFGLSVLIIDSGIKGAFFAYMGKLTVLDVNWSYW